MTQPEQAYLHPYLEAGRQHGASFDVTLWASPASQRVRFDVLVSHCDLTGKHLLDAGCSRGDLAAYLIAHHIAFERYTGVDAMEQVIEHARSRNMPRCDFVVDDLVVHPDVLLKVKADLIFFSGTLNTMDQSMALALLDKAWQATRETLVFNFLSNTCGPAAPTQLKPAKRFETLSMLAWAMTKTSQVIFRQDYMAHGHDATIVMHRSAR